MLPAALCKVTETGLLYLTNFWEVWKLGEEGGQTHTLKMQWWGKPGTLRAYQWVIPVWKWIALHKEMPRATLKPRTTLQLRQLLVSFGLSVITHCMHYLCSSQPQSCVPLGCPPACTEQGKCPGVSYTVVVWLISFPSFSFASSAGKSTFSTTRVNIGWVALFQK